MSLSRFAEERRERFGVVGGPVRDLLLGKSLQEIDLLIEGDAIAFARSFVEQSRKYLPDFPRPRLSSGFEKFGTIKLFYPDECGKLLRVVDFASAREESYPTPGRAPVVNFPVSFEVDLKRRDFSVNCLLFLFSGSSTVSLLDPFHGAEDLQKKRLRILHEKSFVDDPARLLRGIRFQVRFGFEWEPDTACAFENACAEGGLFTLTPQRRFDEFRKALREEEVVLILKRFAETGILTQIHPEIDLEESELYEARKEGDNLVREAKLLASLLKRLPLSEYEKHLKEWGFSRKMAADFVKVRSDVA